MFKATHPKKRTLTQTQDNATPQKQKWATFTYIGKETTRITNLFKHTNIKIAFRTNKTIQKLLTHSCYTKDKYSASGIYKLTCSECNKAYVGSNKTELLTTLPGAPPRLQTRSPILRLYFTPC